MEYYAAALATRARSVAEIGLDRRRHHAQNEGKKKGFGGESRFDRERATKQPLP